MRRADWRTLLLDPLFLGACALYGLNRWALLPNYPELPPFFSNHFNDVLLIPAGLPVLLALYVALKLRAHWLPASVVEVLAHLALWSVICEWIGPVWLQMGTADIWDVAAYSAGAVVAMLVWTWRRRCFSREFAHRDEP